MTWILLAVLGVPLWLIAGVLASAFWSRHRFRGRPEVFACRLRPAGPAKTSGWSRTKSYAYWVHDVLLVHHGLALARYEVLPVSSVAGPTPASSVKGLGDRPEWLRLQLDDGRMMDMATQNQDVALATGPFVAASLV
jgi:hypothetical protein